MPVKCMLRQIRWNKDKMKQKELAVLADIPAEQISRWERENAVPSLKMALRLAKVLGCHVDDIFILEESE